MTYSTQIDKVAFNKISKDLLPPKEVAERNAWLMRGVKNIDYHIRTWCPWCLMSRKQGCTDDCFSHNYSKDAN